MTEFIPQQTAGDTLREDFMKPLHLSAYRLAKEIQVPSSRILDIIHNKRGISVDTSIRLGRFFGLSDGYFINLQTSFDLEDSKIKNQQEYNEIKQYKPN